MNKFYKPMIFIFIISLTNFTLQANVTFKNSSHKPLTISIKYKKNHHHTSQTTTQTISTGAIASLECQDSIESTTLTDSTLSYDINTLTYNGYYVGDGKYFEIISTPNNKTKYAATEYTDSSFKNRKNLPIYV